MPETADITSVPTLSLVLLVFLIAAVVGGLVAKRMK
jgi:hypothetical protein